jgi:hypothetical protein
MSRDEQLVLSGRDTNSGWPAWGRGGAQNGRDDRVDSRFRLLPDIHWPAYNKPCAAVAWLPGAEGLAGYRRALTAMAARLKGSCTSVGWDMYVEWLRAGHERGQADGERSVKFVPVR